MKSLERKPMSTEEQALWSNVKGFVFSDKGAVVVMFVAMFVAFLVELV
ncbi:MAG TPA: hypothetical protein VI423_02965 [Paenisporosarcina sp.]|nr:hypothetical protein [Paenisporosarcina sp.]